MAQILCYYRYPNSTLAEIPAYTTATEGISMEGVAKGIVIDWDNILDDYNNGYSEKIMQKQYRQENLEMTYCRTH